jgi:hypothetical protein
MKAQNDDDSLVEGYFYLLQIAMFVDFRVLHYLDR